MDKKKFIDIWRAIQTEACNGDLENFLDYYGLNEDDYKEFEKHIESYLN